MGRESTHRRVRSLSVRPPHMPKASPVRWACSSHASTTGQDAVAAVGTLDTATSGYHETLTCFWTSVVSRLVKGYSDPWPAARRAVEGVGQDRDLHLQYYSFDVVRDAKARASFVPPDREGPY